MSGNLRRSQFLRGLQSLSTTNSHYSQEVSSPRPMASVHTSLGLVIVRCKLGKMLASCGSLIERVRLRHLVLNR